MSVDYQLILYKTDAQLFGKVFPTMEDFTHAVLRISEQGKHHVLDYSKHGVQVNRMKHTSKGNGWFKCEELAHFGTVVHENEFPQGVTWEKLLHFATHSQWTPEYFNNTKLRNCLAFAISVIVWGHAGCDEPPAKRQAISSPVLHAGSTSQLTARFGKTLSATVCSFGLQFANISRLPPPAQHPPCPFVSRFPPSTTDPLPVPSSSGNTVGDLLNSRFAGSTFSEKKDVIGFIFKNSHLTGPQIQTLVPTVSLSEIKKSLADANKGPLKIEVKRRDTSRSHVKKFETKFFRESMLPYFTQPLSGSVANKHGISLLRTSLKPLGLYAKYVCHGVKTMVKLANIENSAALRRSDGYADLTYPDVSPIPRHFEFFRAELLDKLICYKEERNVKRCHYCDSYAAAKEERIRLLGQENFMSEIEYKNALRDNQEELRVGERHEWRYHNQNGYINQLKHNLPQRTCLIQTDYFSFYSYTSKVNILGLVLRFNNELGVSQIEHVQYVSCRPHDYLFSATGFEHTFSIDADILVNERGPKFDEVVLTGDTAMFKGQFLCCLRTIAVNSGIPSVRCVPLATKHGSNEVDGDGGRVKPLAEQMVLESTFNEKNLAPFCADIMALYAGSNCRAYPITGLIKTKTPYWNAMLPGGSPANLLPPKRGYGEFQLTAGPEAFQLWCRTDVGVDEPWKLEKEQGYPLPKGQQAPPWAFVDMSSPPSSQCLPCASLLRKPVAKNHAACVFSDFNFNRCGLCGLRSGHNATNCGFRLRKNCALLIDELKEMCVAFHLKPDGSKTALLNRVRDHFVHPDLEEESDSELSDEVEEEFDLTRSTIETAARE